MCIRFVRMYGRDRQTNGRTHRHRMTAQAALAQRRAAKKTAFEVLYSCTKHRAACLRQLNFLMLNVSIQDTVYWRLLSAQSF